MNARFAGSLLMGLCACLAACSDSDDGPRSATTAQSWDCIVAMQIAGFTTGTPISDARTVLDRLAGDPELPQAERDYFAVCGAL